MPLQLDFTNAAHKNQLVAGLATLLVADCGNIDAGAIDAAVKASGNTLPKGFSSVFAAYANKQGTAKMCPPLGGGGGGGAAPAAAAAAPAAAAPAVKEKPKEVEVDPMEGGMDMFGGGAKGGGDY
jgi:hypothetical protein